MGYKCLILDFDGTFTDVVSEAEPFVEAFRSDLFDLLGRDETAAWEHHWAAVSARPQEHGWVHDGMITAPGNADPYTRTACVSQKICDDLGVLSDAALRSRVMQLIYARSYLLTRWAPRDDAKAVLETLLATDKSVFVVTNSATEHVQRKIDALELAGAAELAVIGNARKFVVDPTSRGEPFDSLTDLALPGLSRPVFVKRGHYYDALVHCWREANATASETLVCGDIFELDLALPMVLGTDIHLVHRSDAPQHEVAFVTAHERGAASTELAGVLDRL